LNRFLVQNGASLQLPHWHYSAVDQSHQIDEVVPNLRRHEIVFVSSAPCLRLVLEIYFAFSFHLYPVQRSAAEHPYSLPACCLCHDPILLDPSPVVVVP
jgi:hypothetical protein